MLATNRIVKQEFVNKLAWPVISEQQSGRISVEI